MQNLGILRRCKDSTSFVCVCVCVCGEMVRIQLLRHKWDNRDAYCRINNEGGSINQSGGKDTSDERTSAAFGNHVCRDLRSSLIANLNVEVPTLQLQPNLASMLKSEDRGP